ncbi:MAG: site-specific integrase [Metallibacterium scheffleri]|jgi:integrase|uniref:integrase n=1 Tax=Metallibacterium scheffleri TaxID=993689 RepID=UPI0026F3030F|nr:site-specific integrase [Metallibacterium scheffleri]MCK9366785.1 site-specific integrase [Metallibacterium scheffleri]
MATITQRESGRWQAKVRRQGQSPLSRTFKTKADAEAWARKFESEQERGIWRDSAEADRTTLGDCLDRYVREQVPRKRDPARERSHVDALRALPFAGRAMSHIRSADVAAARDAWALAAHAPATIVRRLAVLSRVFNVARREWGMESLVNPVETITKPIISNARDRRVSDKEIDAICAATGSAELAAFIRMAVETAMRRGELCALRWEHVDLRACTAHLPHTKNGHARTVPLSSGALKVLRELPRCIDGQVFSMRPDSITQAFERAAERAGIENVRLHDLRHEATSRMADKLQAHELAKVTGHRDMRMVLRYYHPRASDLAKKLG